MCHCCASGTVFTMEAEEEGLQKSIDEYSEQVRMKNDMVLSRLDQTFFLNPINTAASHLKASCPFILCPDKCQISQVDELLALGGPDVGDDVRELRAQLVELKKLTEGVGLQLQNLFNM